jgi:hypothetical protein
LHNDWIVSMTTSKDHERRRDDSKQKTRVQASQGAKLFSFFFFLF